MSDTSEDVHYTCAISSQDVGWAYDTACGRSFFEPRHYPNDVADYQTDDDSKVTCDKCLEILDTWRLGG